MKIKKATVFLLMAILLLAFNATSLRAQYNPYNSKDNSVSTQPEKSIDKKTDKKSDKKADKGYYVIEASRWPTIQHFGVYSSLIVWISFILGLSIFLIARFAGAKESKVKIWLSVFTAVAIGTFSRSLDIKLREGLFWLFSLVSNDVTASSIADFLSYVLWLLFTAGVAVHFYEIVTVTAREVFQNR